MTQRSPAARLVVASGFNLGHLAKEHSRRSLSRDVHATLRRYFLGAID
ncbi:MAG: hypothetical protein WB784_01205 [Rhodanobacteraceae bacterium]